jgi:hypothetical protein
MNELLPLSSTEQRRRSDALMYNEAKMLAYAKWHELLTDSEILMDAQERYDGLLKLADDYRCKGIIDMSERNTLIEFATAAYTRSVADVTSQTLKPGVL